MNLPDTTITPADLLPKLQRFWQLSTQKIHAIEQRRAPDEASPVFTVNGKYTAQGWTEWTQGFQFGNMILTGDAIGDDALIDLGRRRTLELMAPHVTHTGVHDHGFNNLSTYGNLRRLLHEGRLQGDSYEGHFYDLALKASGAVQAARWSGTPGAPDDPHAANSKWLGYVYSFNGPHSLFIDTMRTIRILGVAWRLGHPLMHEGDRAANLLRRSVLHGLTTSRHIVFHGDTQQTYDVAGRTAHEGVFNRNDGAFRTRATQQGYSAFSTWTRGLAWAMLGYAEELEFFATIDDAAFSDAVGLSKADVVAVYERCAKQTCDHYLNEATASDGIPYWDDGAPQLHRLGAWREMPADPYNDFEPVDSSAAAIACQGLIRLGNYLGNKSGKHYAQAGLRILETLLGDPYLSTDANHEGLTLHSVYHCPNGWDHVPAGRKVPCDESSMWGDYHTCEAALLVQRLAKNKPYYTFYGAAGQTR